MSHADYMQKALKLAWRGKGTTSPNPMVGALIVRNNKIIAQGWHRRYGGDHAEVDALKKAKGELSNAKMYVTLEPCFHTGRTPPCVEALVRSGIREVIIGTRDPNPLTNGKSIAKLRKAKIKVTVGVLQKEAHQMNEVFNKYITHKMPFVVAKCAQTIDGKIATRTGASKWITSARSRDAARKLRGQFDAILVGINTVLMDDPGLNPSNQKKSFKKIVLDSDLKISLQAKLFKGMDLKNCIIATTKRCSPTKRKQLIQKGVTVIECPLSAGHVQLRWLFRKLAQMRIASILIEGGSRVIGRALEHQLVDKMHIYISPQIMGDSRALSSVMGHKASRLGQLIKLKNIKVNRIGEDIFLSGYVHRHR